MIQQVEEEMDVLGFSAKLLLDHTQYLDTQFYFFACQTNNVITCYDDYKFKIRMS